MLIIVICFLMENKSLSLTPTKKMLTFRLNFVLEAYLMYTDYREASLNRNVYDFSSDYSSIDQSDILNIHNYSVMKNNIK